MHHRKDICKVQNDIHATFHGEIRGKVQYDINKGLDKQIF